MPCVYGEQAGKEEEQETWGGQRHRAEIASEEVHSQSNIVFPAFLLAAKGAPFTSPLVESWLSGFAREQRVCLVDLS